jgi:urea transport system ATP-binding protein
MLTVEKLRVAYGETLILNGVDLEVAPGQVVCLMGRNGVGKTTLLKSITGLLRPRSGRVCFAGKDLVDAPANGSAPSPLARCRQWLRKLCSRGYTPDVRARMGLGYVPQGREIFPQLTVLENLQVGLLANPGRPRQVPGYVFDYFPALKSMLDRKGGFLSGGQQQQLAIARALVAEPRLLILDEPTEGIQPSIISLVGRVLRSLKEGGKVAILLVEQYLEFALKLADRYYVMEKGAIVLKGNSAEQDREAIKPYLAF